MAPRIRFNTAKDLFQAFPVALEDMAAGPSDRPSLEFVKELLSSPTPEDAITFSAYLLGPREAVWWGHQALSLLVDRVGPEDVDLMAAAESWVRQPSEERRAAALEAGMASATKTPGAWIALGAGWSGGSMAPVGSPPVEPPAYLTAKAINAGILSALARVDRKQRGETLRQLVDMAIRLATRA